MEQNETKNEKLAKSFEWIKDNSYFYFCTATIAFGRQINYSRGQNMERRSQSYRERQYRCNSISPEKAVVQD